MRVRYETRDGVTVATVESPVIFGGEPARQFVEEIREWIERESLVVVDVSRVLDIAPDGLDVLLALQRNLLDRAGWIVLAGLDPEIRRRFRSAGLDAVFVLQPDVEQGLLSLKLQGSGLETWH